MDLTKLTITDLFLYKEMVSAMIEAGEADDQPEESIEALYEKLDKLDNEIYSRVESI